MNPSGDPLLDLASRLRALRMEGFGQRITQRQLAEAFSGIEAASVPLISSWESVINPKVPPDARIEAYATFFATERSAEREPFRLLDPAELNPEERARRDALFHELTTLRNAALRHPAGEESGRSSLFRFPDQEEVSVVCAELPERRRAELPYTDPDDPDYVHAYTLTDLDALIEIYGHLRAVNPMSRVTIATPSQVVADRYTAHLVVLGGVDFNPVTRALLDRIPVPVQQTGRDTDADAGAFEVREGTKVRRFEPELRMKGERRVLFTDVAQVYRGPNPFNTRRTVTVCNGMFARGTLGAVRALTDPLFRERNENYLRGRFVGSTAFSVLTRVHIAHHEAVTPDWTQRDTLLHEWPPRS